MQNENITERATVRALRRDFQRFLECGGYCTPPGRAACALDNARTLAQWRELESAGRVRIVAEPELEPYDPGDCGEAYTNIHGRRVSAEEAQKEIAEMLERDGHWRIVSYWHDGNEWQHADSIGGCAGYSNPCSPFENCYVPDLMNSAIKESEREGWQYEVANGDTVLGFTEWLEHKAESQSISRD